MKIVGDENFDACSERDTEKRMCVNFVHQPAIRFQSFRKKYGCENIEHKMRKNMNYANTYMNKIRFDKILAAPKPFTSVN